MTSEETSKLDSVTKVDLSNASMLCLMLKYYRYNMRTINFWLDKLVFPTETMQFPRRLVANSWHLADNARNNVIGFSGTNDNKILLPLQVTQSAQDIPQLEATNGKMLATFLSKSTVTCLEQEKDIAEAVLSVAVSSKCSALIDVGALMAGLSNKEVAERVCILLKTAGSKLKGAVFFDNSKNAWSFRSDTGRVWHLDSSPVQEQEAFVYFDESRCRGADMKLSPDAVAALTIGPGICKDKLMQAAFRMRQLTRDQSLNLLIPVEVRTKVVSFTSCSSETLRPKHILDWVLMNTVEWTTGSLAEWAHQGSYFCTTKRNPNLRLMDENLDLSDMYALPFTRTSVSKIVVQQQKWFRKRCQNDNSVLSDLMQQISNRAYKFGQEIFTHGSNCDEECERELENERELEREAERQIPRQVPVNEKNWDYSSIFEADSPQNLPSNVGVVSLKSVCLKLSCQFQHILWDDDIYVTRNFFHTVHDLISMKTVESDLAHFLRPIDAAMYFEKSRMLLLLSEREADSILELFWQKQSVKQHVKSTDVFFVHLSFLKSALGKICESPLSLQIPGQIFLHSQLAPSRLPVSDSLLSRYAVVFYLDSKLYMYNIVYCIKIEKRNSFTVSIFENENLLSVDTNTP